MAQPQTNPYLPPDIQLQQINLQRQQALADALKQQSLESTPSEVVSGRVVPKGLLGAIAPLLRAGLAVKTQDNVNQGTAKVAQSYNDYLTNSSNMMFPGGTLGQSSPMPEQPTQGGVSASTLITAGLDPSMATPDQPAPQAQSGVQLPPQLKAAYVNALRMGNQEGANKLLEMAWQAQMPTDMTKMAAAAGVDTAAANRGAIQKNNYIAPIDARPGNFVLDPITKQPIFNAPNAQGIQYTPGPNGTFTAANVPGSLPALQNVATAENMGKAAATPYSGVDANGNPLPVTSVANVLSPSGPPATNPQDQAAIAAFNQAGRPNGAATPWQYDPSNPSAQAPVNAAPKVYAAPPMGTADAIKGTVDTVNQHWQGINQAAQNAPNQISILENIKAHAPMAITGGEADKRAYINSLLALGGIGAAPDLKTATDLLNKNASMLAANMRLSAGNGGSDALQTLAQAANPNSHMSVDAIKQASDQILGQVKMGQQLQTILEPFKLSNDVNGYQRTLTQFNKIADPRIYQMQSMSSADAAKFAKSQPDYSALKEKYQQGAKLGWWQ